MPLSIVEARLGAARTAYADPRRGASYLYFRLAGSIPGVCSPRVIESLAMTWRSRVASGRLDGASVASRVAFEGRSRLPSPGKITVTPESEASLAHGIARRSSAARLQTIFLFPSILPTVAPRPASGQVSRPRD